MKLTKAELARLKKIKYYREHPPTDSLLMLREVWKIKAKIIPLVLLIVVLSLLPFLIFPPTPGRYILVGFGFGALCGVFLCVIVWMRMVARQWPLSREILDWEKVEELLKEQEQPNN